MSYDGDLEHDPGWDRSRGDNESIRAQRMAEGKPYSHLDHIIGVQCESEARGRSLGQNVDVYAERTSRGKNAGRTLKVIYEQIKAFFGR